MKILPSLLVLTAAVSSLACDNPFGYSYIAETTKVGHFEFEQFITSRLGRDVGAGYEAGYRGFDLNTEIEYGISTNEQLSLYINTRYIDSSVREGMRFNGINLAYKRMLADPDKNSWGRAIYLEGTYSQASSSTGAFRNRYGIEAKYIFQHNFGENSGWIYAANLITEVTHTSGTGEDAVEFKLTQGIAREINQEWTIGLEVVAEAEWVEMNDFEAAGLFIGPVLNYRKGPLSASLTFLAQAVGSPQDKGSLNVSEYSPYQARLRFSYEF